MGLVVVCFFFLVGGLTAASNLWGSRVQFVGILKPKCSLAGPFSVVPFGCSRKRTASNIHCYLWWLWRHPVSNIPFAWKAEQIRQNIPGLSVNCSVTLHRNCYSVKCDVLIQIVFKTRIYHCNINSQVWRAGNMLSIPWCRVRSLHVFR